MTTLGIRLICAVLVVAGDLTDRQLRGCLEGEDNEVANLHATPQRPQLCCEIAVGLRLVVRKCSGHDIANIL